MNTSETSPVVNEGADDTETCRRKYAARAPDTTEPVPTARVVQPWHVAHRGSRPSCALVHVAMPADDFRSSKRAPPTGIISHVSLRLSLGRSHFLAVLGPFPLVEQTFDSIGICWESEGKSSTGGVGSE
jgi:hypothetical protein